MSNVLWSPQPKQKLFMSEPAFEVLYGGAAGGGKSDALVVEALRQVAHPHYQGLIIRKTYPQLTEVINRSLELYHRIYPNAKYNDGKHVWSFPSGAKIYFGSMQHTKDKVNYQGKQFQFIGVDECTHFNLEEYMFLKSRCRARAQGQRCYIRATANPGGIGHGWVKDRFVSNEPYKRYYEVVEVEGKKLVQDRCYIPATVFDNRKLLENDPNYLATLATLPEADKQAFLYGNWDSFNGQVFQEWANRPEHYDDRRYTHVINPFMIPSNWRIYRGFDFGYSKPFSVGWFAVDTANRVYHIAELYGCTGQPDVGVKWDPHKIAREIRQIEQEHPNLKGKKIIGIADPSIYDESRGESVGAMMEKERIYFTGADNTRIAGKMQYHYRLAFDDDGIPMFYVFNTCKHFIRTIPNLVYDETKVEDINTKTEDHIYDMCRYVLMDNPIGPRPNSSKNKKVYNPLDDDFKPNSNYNFYKMY